MHFVMRIMTASSSQSPTKESLNTLFGNKSVNIFINIWSKNIPSGKGWQILICMPQQSCYVDLSHHHLFAIPLSDCFLTRTPLHTDFVTCASKRLPTANTASMMTAPSSMSFGIVHALPSYEKIGPWSSAIAKIGPLVQ